MKRLGLIVNPAAGLGGRVGLKGSDGAEVQRQARELGAAPEAPGRAHCALEALREAGVELEILTCPGSMGEEPARQAGFNPQVIGTPSAGETTAEDTREAARRMLGMGVDLLLFAGGDGTARDIFQAVGSQQACLGIPAGVKIHSGVFATYPRQAGELAGWFLAGRKTRLQEAEVVDLDEDAYRAGKIAERLYGTLTIPYRPELLQGRKEPTPDGESASARAIAADIVESLEEGWLYILGPGTTTRAIARWMGMEKTLVGVDVFSLGKTVALDVNEAQILSLIEGQAAKIIVTPIGGQGFIFGRGNQPISARVIERVGRENLLVVSTPGKLNALRGRALLADTGDARVDVMLAGYVRVISGYNERSMYRISTDTETN